MSGHTPNTPSTGILAKLYAEKWTFLALAFVVFGASVVVLSSFDVLPEAPKAQAPALTQTQAVAEAQGVLSLPEKISIPKINLAVVVANPATADPAILDENLLYGAVRYPNSGTLGQAGKNMVIFGHSSYLPVVHNKAYKAFDGIQNLAHGDQILVSGNGKTYVYEVETVAQASTATDGIPVEVQGSKLTLVTCDSFKTKSDRFVVVAHLVESYPSTN